MSAAIFRAIGTIGLGLESGAILSITPTGIPALRHITNTAEAQAAFTTLFTNGRGIMVPIGIATGISFLLAQYKSAYRPKLYYYAAASAVLIAPFTLIFMNSTNELIMSSPAAQVAPNLQDLFTKWATLNTIRGLIPLSGFIAVIWTNMGY